MATDIKMTKFFNLDPNALFDYFVRPDLAEKWQAPEGMTLKIPKFEAKVGGRYRYEHTAKDGVYQCEGEIREFEPGRKLVQFDESIKGPDGKDLYKNLLCTVEFAPVGGGTEVRVVQDGFENAGSAQECEMGWRQSFDKLNALINKKADISSGKDFNGEDRMANI